MPQERKAWVQLLLATRGLGLVVLLANALLASAEIPAGTPSFAGKVVGVHDGDTISVMRDGRAERVRLDGIDCPENGQDFSRRAKEATSKLVFGRIVVVEDRGRDRYGRIVGRVFLNGLDLSFELVRQGMAWHFKRYSSEQALADAEDQARAAKRGLWVQADATPPWEWRRSRP